jgi:hypothetical protein
LELSQYKPQGERELSLGEVSKWRSESAAAFEWAMVFESGLL